jgi:hypothetical protein
MSAALRGNPCHDYGKSNGEAPETRLQRFAAFLHRETQWLAGKDKWLADRSAGAWSPRKARALRTGERRPTGDDVLIAYEIFGPRILNDVIDGAAADEAGRVEYARRLLEDIELLLEQRGRS